MCDPCKALEKKINRKIERKQRGSQTPAKDKAPLAACGPEKLRATVNASRLKCKELGKKNQPSSVPNRKTFSWGERILRERYFEDNERTEP